MHGVVVFFQKWRTQLVMAGLLVVGLGVVFAGFQVIRAQQAKIQSRTLGEILALRADLPKVPENVAKLEALTGKGMFGRVASLGLATYWLEQGQTDKAQTALSSIKDSPRDFYYYQAKNLEAEILLLKSDPDGALAILNKIVEEKPKDYVLDAVLFRQAEALEKKGKTAEALALYKKVQAEYPQSYFGYDASLKVNKLEGARKRP
jgi:predicted negative regulator of RcsB-dependent stress response